MLGISRERHRRRNLYAAVPSFGSTNLAATVRPLMTCVRSNERENCPAYTRGFSSILTRAIVAMGGVRSHALQSTFSIRHRRG